MGDVTAHFDFSTAFWITLALVIAFFFFQAEISAFIRNEMSGR